MFRLGRRHDRPLPFVRRRPTVNPILPVDDMQAAIGFYRRLGFEVNSYDEGYAWVKHCGWEWFHVRLVDSVEGNRSSLYLHVDDADVWRSALQDTSGGSVEMTTASDTPWGMREFSFHDPAGNLVRVGSRR